MLGLAVLQAGCFEDTDEGGPSADFPTDPAQARDARDAILAAFDVYDVVGGMNAGHGNKDADDFILDLIRDSRFPDKANDIAVECGNSGYQNVLDRYIAGEDVALAEVRPVWRNTGEPQCGFSTFYEQLVPLVRRINFKLPAERKLRILAGDSPVDWNQVNSLEDLEAFGDQGEITSSMIEQEVLAKSRKVLLLFGINHVRHGDFTVVGRLEQRGYRNAYVIAEHIGFGNRSSLGEDNDMLEERMASWPTPSLASIADTWLAQLDSGYFNQDPGELGYPGVDGYLYLGPRDSLLREPLSAQTMLDQDYIAELRQRAARIGVTPDRPLHPDSIVQREAVSTAFLYEPAR